MSERLNDNPNNLPRVLEPEIDEQGRPIVYFSGVTGGDFFATLRFFSPNEQRYNAQISYLFDEAVRCGMLSGTTVNFGNPQVSEMDGVQSSQLGICFAKDPTPNQVRNSFLKALNLGPDSVPELEVRILRHYIDAGAMPISGVVISAENEIRNATEGQIKAELDNLTRRFFEGEDMGGPAVG